MSRSSEAHDSFYASRNHGGGTEYAHPLLGTLEKHHLAEGSNEYLNRQISEGGGWGVPKNRWSREEGGTPKTTDESRHPSQGGYGPVSKKSFKPPPRLRWPEFWTGTGEH